jgi:hypothetical protein
MKNFLIIVAVIGILGASASVSYYYLVFLPKQSTKSEQDTSNRKTLAPTTDNQKVEANYNYLACIEKMAVKSEIYLQVKCPYDETDSNRTLNCRIKAMQSSEYSQFQCSLPY